MTHLVGRMRALRIYLYVLIFFPPFPCLSFLHLSSLPSVSIIPSFSSSFTYQFTLSSSSPTLSPFCFPSSHWLFVLSLSIHPFLYTFFPILPSFPFSLLSFVSSFLFCLPSYLPLSLFHFFIPFPSLVFLLCPFLPLFISSRPD